MMMNYHVLFSVVRSIYQKFREVDLLDKKKTVTALKPGEDRAIFLGLGMILSSVVMYFVLGVTIFRSYADRCRNYTRAHLFYLCCFCQKKNVLFIRRVVLLTQPASWKNKKNKQK